MTPLIAQSVLAGSVAHWAILLIVIAGVVGVLMVVARQAGVEIPAWVITIGWICLAVLVGVAAIKFIMGMV